MVTELATKKHAIFTHCIQFFKGQIHGPSPIKIKWILGNADIKDAAQSDHPIYTKYILRTIYNHKLNKKKEHLLS